MKLGYRIKRQGWQHLNWIDINKFVFIKLVMEDVLTADWEVITQGIIKDFPITYSD